jgi:hypothetical protein
MTNVFAIALIRVRTGRHEFGLYDRNAPNEQESNPNSVMMEMRFPVEKAHLAFFPSLKHYSLPISLGIGARVIVKTASPSVRLPLHCHSNRPHRKGRHFDQRSSLPYERIGNGDGFLNK